MPYHLIITALILAPVWVALLLVLRAAYKRSIRPMTTADREPRP